MEGKPLEEKTIEEVANHLPVSTQLQFVRAEESRMNRQLRIINTLAVVFCIVTLVTSVLILSKVSHEFSQEQTVQQELKADVSVIDSFGSQIVGNEQASIHNQLSLCAAVHIQCQGPAKP